jgi:DNA invertase Pin-like site-specific DNA recombinase
MPAIAASRKRGALFSAAAGKRFLDMPVAEFETNLRRERQLEGIAKAKAAGAHEAGHLR